MQAHPNQKFAMFDTWQPKQQRLSEILLIKCAIPQDLSVKMLASNWYQQKLVEFRFDQKNRVDEYLDPIKYKEYDWTLHFANMLKNSYLASKRIQEKVQQGQLEQRNDPQHQNIQQLLQETEAQDSNPRYNVPEQVDARQLERFIQFSLELNGRKPLPSQIETWISQLAAMNKTQQKEQINYSISIGKTIIYPPRTDAKAETRRPVSDANAAKQQKQSLEQDRHQHNLSLNGIHVAAHIHRGALCAFLDERFTQEKKAMSATRLQALVDMLSSMTSEDQAAAIRHAIIGNYKTIYPPRSDFSAKQKNSYGSVRDTGRRAAAEIEQELKQELKQEIQAANKQPRRSFITYEQSDNKSHEQ